MPRLLLLLHALGDTLLAPAEVTLDDAKQLFARGQTCYETADYGCAIDLWTMAYDEVSQAATDDPHARALLLYNLAQAHRRAYEVDRDIEHLRRARALLLTYLELLEVVTQSPDARAREQLETERVLDELDAELARSEAHSLVVPVAVPADAVPSPSGKRPGLALEIVGANVLAFGLLGGAGLALAGTLIGREANDFAGIEPSEYEARTTQLERGRRANLLAQAGAGAGGALLVLGVALIAGGVAMDRKHARSSGRARAWQLLPSVDARGQLGLHFGGSF